MSSNSQPSLASSRPGNSGFDELSEAVWDKLYVNAACDVCVEVYAAGRREAYLLDVNDKYLKPQMRDVRQLDVADAYGPLRHGVNVD
jgi:hypothetical protein